MLYVENSLSQGEEVIAAARFHWFYTFGAVIWVITGIVAAVLTVWTAGAYYITASGANGALSADPISVIYTMRSMSVGEVFQVLQPFWQYPSHIRIAAFGCLLIGLLMFAMKMIVRATTEIAVTNKRLIYKRGLIARTVEELGVDRIEGVDFEQTILGRILGFGRVMAYGMGVGDVKMPRILDDPLGFRKSIESAKVSANTSSTR